MSKFNREQLTVRTIPPANSLFPIEGRKYTLTHSDLTSKLSLDIGTVFNFEAIDPQMRDEVLAEWHLDRSQTLNLIGKVDVDGIHDSEIISKNRFDIFKREMATALKGIVNGDQQLFVQFPFLLDARIFIYFESSFPQYDLVYFAGTPKQYLKSVT